MDHLAFLCSVIRKVMFVKSKKEVGKIDAILMFSSYSVFVILSMQLSSAAL